mgnify:FL=1
MGTVGKRRFIIFSCPISHDVEKGEKNNMNINLSDETIKTIEKALLTRQFLFKEKIELAAYTGKISEDRVSEFKSELARVEIAISEFNTSINLKK